MGTLPQTKNNDLRVVPLSRETRAILAAVPRHVSHEFVFVNAGTDRPWDPFYVSHTFARVGRLTGIPNYRFHDLRHTFASYLSLPHLRESVEKLSAAYRYSDNLVTSTRHQTSK